MPPNPVYIPLTTSRHVKRSTALPQGLYLGLDISITKARDKFEYCICTHDGSFSNDTYLGNAVVDPTESRLERVRSSEDQLIDVIRKYSQAQQFKIHACAVGMEIGDEESSFLLYRSPSLVSRLWLELDAIPFVMPTDGINTEERASAAVRKAVIWFTPQFPGSIPRISVGFRHEVEVDLSGQIHLVDLGHYEATVCKETWRVLMEIANEVKNRRLKISFFNSTPQGGGVALMRHSLIRFCRLLNIDVHWFVAKPNPKIFDITKRKFHNVLQGVAPPDVRLTEEEMADFDEWTRQNVERFWSDAKGPLRTSDVIVIDDPQVCGVIPYVRKLSPAKTKVIYRSHIEICADLIRNNPNGPQAVTWNFLWDKIRYADLFISHPIDNSIPDDVPRKNVVLMPACTDPLDGLNKDISSYDMDYYKAVFNRVCMDQASNEVDWTRPYVVQVARFDPSKGIPGVIESYRRLRVKLAQSGKFEDEDNIPQLIICGHGSVDDPDGTLIFEQTHAMIHSNTYASISEDIIIVRAPPCDQLLNTVLRNAYIAVQLSHREGFEVKITEALAKGVPVVAYKAGGIPWQLIHGKDGFLIPIGDVEAVADTLFNLFCDPELRAEMSTNAIENLTEEYFTPYSAINWLFLANEISRNQDYSAGLHGEDVTLQRNKGIGNGLWVKEFWMKKYDYSEEHVKTKVLGPGASELDDQEVRDGNMAAAT